MNTDHQIKCLATIFKDMVENYNGFGTVWKNIPLATEAFAILTEQINEVVPGEIESDKDKARLVVNMLDNMDPLNTPRLCLKMWEYVKQVSPELADEEEIRRLRDYIDPNLSTDEWRQRYHKTLKFDDVERSEEWERNIYDVEKKVDAKVKGMPRGMGFCFSYWSAKKSVLESYGIEWRSPHQMNPRVLFD